MTRQDSGGRCCTRLWRRWGSTHIPVVGSKAGNWTAVTHYTERSVRGPHCLCIVCCAGCFVWMSRCGRMFGPWREEVTAQ